MRPVPRPSRAILAGGYQSGLTRNGGKGNLGSEGSSWAGITSSGRHLREGVASSLVVADAGLVLAFPAPAGPGPGVFGAWRLQQDDLGQEAADFR